MRLIGQAVRIVQKHPATESLELLQEVVMVMGTLPDLPVRQQFEDLLPENLELDPDDEVELDPTKITRPFACRKERN